MNEIQTMIESLGIQPDDETIEAIEAQLCEDKQQASQASAVHIDF